MIDIDYTSCEQESLDSRSRRLNSYVHDLSWSTDLCESSDKRIFIVLCFHKYVDPLSVGGNTDYISVSFFRESESTEENCYICFHTFHVKKNLTLTDECR